MSDSENVTNETKKLGDSQQSETQQPKNRRAKRRSSPSELSERLAAQTRARHEKVQQQIEQLAQLVTQQEQRIEQQQKASSLLLQDYSQALADVIKRQNEMPSRAELAELQQSLDAFETWFEQHMSK